VSSEVKKCIIRLRKPYCVVYENLVQEEQQKYGTKEYVAFYCSICIKAVYAKAKQKPPSKFSVVNTL
jgi:hypothetical protein